MINFQWHATPYWHQYQWEFPQSVTMLYAEETLYAGRFTLAGGLKKYLVDVSREDQFHVDPNLTVDSDSSLLVSGGVTYETPVEGLDLFAGYAENFRAIGSTLLEVPGRSLAALEPETASNIDVGLQYSAERLALSATGYVIDFDNRIFYLGPQTPGRAQLPDSGRRRLLQRRRHRDERRRTLGDGADAAPALPVHGLHAERLRVRRQRRRPGRREPEHHAGDGRHRGAGIACGSSHSTGPAR